MSIEIKQISIKGTVIAKGNAVHLSLKGDPINPYLPLWQKNRPNPDDAVTIVTNPAAFTKTNFKFLILETTLSVTGAVAGSYQLNGYDALYYPNTIPLFSSHIFKISDTSLIVDVSPSKCYERFFGVLSRITDAITWVISPPNDDVAKRETIGTTALEIYTLYDGVDFRYFRRGVPVEILRYLDVVYINYFSPGNNPHFPHAGQDEVKIKTLVEYIVKACFFRNPPRYDIYLGRSHFSSIQFCINKTVTGSFFLDMYLNAFNDFDALCDCKDQAAALYAFLSAVGIGNVDICCMAPFGYLKLAMLVGREFVNSPIYKGNPEDKIVCRNKDGRSFFYSHYFCAWKKNPGKTKILDACVGPHTGSKSKDYVDAVIDKVHPGEFVSGTVEDITPSKKIDVTVDYIQYLGPKPENKTHYFTVCEWADPRACPVLGPDWNIQYEKTFAGDIEVLKVWKLRKKGESIHIKLYVITSADSERRKDRFCSIYESTPHEDGKNPYEEGHTYLGKMALQSSFGNVRRVFWVPYFTSLGPSNVTFDIMCTNTTFNFEALLVWLNEMALTRKTSSIGPFTPSMKSLTFGKSDTMADPKVGDRVTVSMTSRKNLMLDFLLEDDSGLRLIGQGDHPPKQTGIRRIPLKKKFFLEFIAFNKSKNKVRIIAVDKDTLLCNSEIITINLE